MRPEQKVILSTRGTGERAERLLEWLGQSRSMLKSQSRALQIEVRAIGSELLAIVEAVEQRPTAGVIGGWGAPRAALVGALLNDAATAPSDDETRPSLDRDRLTSLIPPDAGGGLAASLRLLAAERAETPYRYPIRLTLLGQLDVVKIIASAYLLHVPPSRQSYTSATKIADALFTNSQQVVPQTYSGVSRRDIDSLRDTLRALAPDHPALRSYEAAGYWDTLGAIIPHLPEASRRQAYALLWGEDPQLTALFEVLSDGIEQLGYASETFAGLDALLGRDPVTGWMARHAESVVAASTIRLGPNRPESRVRTSSRHGRGVDVERFLLAALVDECWLPVTTAALPLLETADMLLMPAPEPVMLWPTSISTSRSPSKSRHAAPTDASQTTVLSAAEALTIFIAQKALHQTDIAVRRHKLTSLVVATDIVADTRCTGIDAGTATVIANWVESTQGDTPHARERRRTGLAILAAESPGSEPTIAPLLTATDGTEPRLAATVAAVLDGNGDWAEEWTPNRPFRNVFTWQPPGLAQEVAGGPSRSADILRFERTKALDGSPSQQSTPLTVSQDLGNLQHAIAQATTSTIQMQQLNARLVELRRAMTDRFLRLHMANDPAAIVEWRRQVCHVARNRLQRAAQSGNFGRLQSALMFSEPEALAVLTRLKAENPRRPVGGATDLRTLEAALIVDACFEAWIVALRQKSRVSALMRTLQVPGPIFAHIIDELVLGAVRIGLAEKLTEAVGRIQVGAARSIDCERSIAVLLQRGIATYVEALDPGARALRTAPYRDIRFGMGVPPTQRVRPDGNRPEATRPSSIADDWAESFADLIEANILGASLLGGTGPLNRELGEVLNTVTGNLFEGTP